MRENRVREPHLTFLIVHINSGYIAFPKLKVYSELAGSIDSLIQEKTKMEY